MTDMKDVKTYHNYDDVTELKKRGYSDEAIRKILRGLRRANG